MGALSVLFIGGTGIISSACVREAVNQGFDVSVMNRNVSRERPVPEGVELIQGDIRSLDAAAKALAGKKFDVVADFVAFTPDHVRQDMELFSGRIGQYVFISSASAYQKPLARLPITESTPLANPFWQYSRDKIACEDLLLAAYRSDGFPATIVRPSHTYDETLTPFHGGWTVVERMRQNKPVVVHGDGTSLWVLTNHRDFAKAFVPILGNRLAIGDAFHITSDEVLTWNQIHEIFADAAGVESPRLVHVASEAIARIVGEWGPGLLGDKSYSVIFDNSKIRQIVPGWQATIPFAAGARDIVKWYDADPQRREIDPFVDKATDELLAYG